MPERALGEQPFRFGVLSHGRSTKAEWDRLARTAEELGYSTLQVPHHFSLRSVPPFIALAMAADATHRLRLGTLVVDNNQQHPAVLANEAAWLARLSDGRFELGLGAGWLAADQTVLGRSWPSPAERASRLTEAVDVIRACWTAAPCDHKGAHYRVASLDNGSDGVASEIPLLIGGGGTNVLQLAARTADIVSIAPTMRSGRIGSASARTATRDQTRAKLDVVRAAAGDRAGSIELHIIVTHVLDPDDGAGIERVARAFGVPVDDVPDIPSVLVGTGDALVDQLRRRRDSEGFSYVTVGDEVMESFAPVVEQLAGR